MEQSVAAGQKVKLSRTNLMYTVLEVFEVRDGSNNGEPTFSSWAKLKAEDGSLAWWKVGQLSTDTPSQNWTVARS